MLGLVMEEGRRFDVTSVHCASTVLGFDIWPFIIVVNDIEYVFSIPNLDRFILDKLCITGVCIGYFATFPYSKYAT